MGQERTHNRRQLIKGITATAGVSTLAGCDIPNVLGNNTVSLPPFKSGWGEIQRNGDAEIILQFDGDILSQLASIPIPASEIVQLITEHDVSVERQPVDIKGTEDLPDSETVEGVSKNAVQVESWPDESFYRIPRVMINKEKTITAAGQELTIKFPADDPTFHIIFPSGYEYTLPGMDNTVSRQPMIDVQRDSGGLVSYAGKSKSRTLLAMAHYDHPDIVWMRAASEYRAKWLSEMATLYDTDYYVEEQFNQVREAAHSISEDLVENAIESILMSPLPPAATTPLDIKSVNDAITNDYTDFRQALESISTVGSMFTAGHRKWMNPLVHTDTEQESTLSEAEADRDLVALGRLARIEFRVVNPLLVSSPDQDLFKSNLSKYRSILEEQQNILDWLWFDSSFNPNRRFDSGDAYWKRLHGVAETFFQESRTMIAEELKVTEAIGSRFS